MVMSDLRIPRLVTKPFFQVAHSFATQSHNNKPLRVIDGWVCRVFISWLLAYSNSIFTSLLFDGETVITMHVAMIHLIVAVALENPSVASFFAVPLVDDFCVVARAWRTACTMYTHFAKHHLLGTPPWYTMVSAVFRGWLGATHPQRMGRTSMRMSSKASAVWTTPSRRLSPGR